MEVELAYRRRDYYCWEDIRCDEDNFRCPQGAGTPRQGSDEGSRRKDSPEEPGSGLEWDSGWDGNVRAGSNFLPFVAWELAYSGKEDAPPPEMAGFASCPGKDCGRSLGDTSLSGPSADSEGAFRLSVSS